MRTDRSDEREMFHRWMLGSPAAVELLSLLSRASQLADDLADEELERVDRERLVAELLYVAFAAVPSNPFFQAHASRLTPHLVTTVVRWRRSNDLAGKPGEAGRFAHVDRFALEDVALSMAEMVGGYEHAHMVAHELMAYYHQDDGEHSVALFRQEVDNR